MEEKTSYAILMTRKSMDYQVYVFVPQYLIEGQIIEEDDGVIFLDNTGKEFLLMDDPENLSVDYESVVGYVISEDDLLKKYPDFCIAEVKVKYFDEICDRTHIGFYLEEKDKIAIWKANFMDIIEKLNCMEFDCDFIDINDLEGENQIDEYGGDHVIVISDDRLDQLLKIDNYECLKKELQQMKQLNDEMIAHFSKDSDSSLSLKKDSNESNHCISSIPIPSSCREFIGPKIKQFFRESNLQICKLDQLKEIEVVLDDIVTFYLDLIAKIETKKNSKKVLEYFLSLVTVYQELQKIEDVPKIKQKISVLLEIGLDDICRQYDQLLEEKEVDLNGDSKESNNSDKMTFDYLKTYQYMISKVIHRKEQIDAILSTIDMVDHNPNTDKKQACLIAGQTGTGKTQTFRELKRALPNRPVVLTDTNQITQQGYIGGSIEDTILKRLVEEAHEINQRGQEHKSRKITSEDIVLAEHGIVFLDEIDKRREHQTGRSDVNGKGVIDQLLKMMDGTNYEVEIGGNSNLDRKTISFDTSHLVIFAGGAFQEYFEQENKRLGYFHEKNSDSFQKYLEVNPEELVKYGLSSQFIGRYSRVILYPPHTKETLLELEQNRETSNIENKRLLFAQLKVSLVWEDDVLEKVAEEAILLKEGGRSLNYILSRCLDPVYSEIKKYPDEYKIIYLNANMIQNPEEVVLIKKDDTIVSMKDIQERNRSWEQRQYQVLLVEKETDAYLKALSILNCQMEDKRGQYVLKKVDS